MGPYIVEFTETGPDPDRSAPAGAFPWSALSLLLDYKNTALIVIKPGSSCKAGGKSVL